MKCIFYQHNEQATHKFCIDESSQFGINLQQLEFTSISNGTQEKVRVQLDIVEMHD